MPRFHGRLITSITAAELQSYLDEKRTSSRAWRGTRKAIRGACKRAGIDPAGITLHTFRRTFITLLEELGTPYGVVRRLARHGVRATDITARYLLPQEEVLRAALNKLARHVLGPATVVPIRRQA